MGKLRHFNHELHAELPEACAILEAANLTVHPSVRQVTLHGSRCIQDGWELGSGVDLSLIVDVDDPSTADEIEAHLKTVLQVTLECWRGPVSADLAAVWDKRDCGLPCFDLLEFDPHICPDPTPGCMGVVKVQEGYEGIVPDEHVDVREMYPCRTVWRRDDDTGGSLSFAGF